MRRLLPLLGLGGVLRPVPLDDLRVVDLRVYPVKSCGGISLSSSRMASTGLAWDRTLAVIDDDGVIQTQRIRRRLAAIRTSMDLDTGRLTLDADGLDRIEVPLAGAAADGCTPIKVRQFGGQRLSGLPAWQYPSRVSDWLTRHLAGSPGLTINGADRKYRNDDATFHLARYDPTKGVRRVMNDIGGDNALPEDQVAFPDLFPLLITARESLAEVNKRSSGPAVGMDRFRPNIVVEGASGAFDEDRWAVVEVGDDRRSMTLRCLENDPRCQIPTIDQRTGEKDPSFEPAKTLRGFRKLFQFDPFRKAGDLASEGPMFGIYATAGAASGELRVGDIVKVVERSNEGESLHEYWSRRRPWTAV